MGVDVKHHRLDFLAVRVRLRCRTFCRVHLFHHPQPERAEHGLKPQFIPERRLVQRKALPQKPERLSLFRLFRRKCNEFQPRRILQWEHIFLLHRPARNPRHQFRFEQVFILHAVPLGFHHLRLVQHIAVDQPARTGPEQPRPAGGLVEESAVLHIKQLHAPMPVPRRRMLREFFQLRTAGQMRKLRRKSGQTLFLTARVQVYRRNIQHPDLSFALFSSIPPFLLRVNISAP